MSGGVDSSTSAYLLKKQGYDVYGVTLCFDFSTINDDFEDAKTICKKLEIPHQIINISKDFTEKVIKYFIDEYNLGLTPSPCIICNPNIKFKILNDIANEIGADFIATGHYALVEFSEFFNTKLLKIPTDKKKDQSYMLYRLSNDIIKKLIFPLKDLKKEEVRKIAFELNIPVHDKKDSQGICFAKEGYIPFLKKSIPEKIKSGNFILKDGTILGHHQGYQLYTLGQRRGLGIKLPRAYFITDIIPQSNTIVLGEYNDLMRKKVFLSDPIFNISFSILKNLNLIAKPRFSSSGLNGQLYLENNKYYFIFDEETPQNAQGQHLVLYYNDFVVGGGKIIF